MTTSLHIHTAGFISPAPGPLAEVAPDILDGTAFFERHPVFVGHDGLNQTCGFVESCRDETDPVARLAHLLRGLCAQLGPEVAQSTPTLHLALPAWAKEIDAFKSRFDAELQALQSMGISRVVPYYGARAAGVSAYLGAQKELTQGSADAVLVGGVDTMVAPPILDARALAGLANTATAPYAAIPSEGGAIQVMTREPEGASNARILAIETGQEPEDLTDPKRGIIGAALQACIARALETHKDITSTNPLTAWLSDFDGARFRAEELGFVAANLGRPELHDPICPAASIGDIGAATVASYVSLLPWACAKTSGEVLISIGDAHGARGALLCQADG